MIHNPGSSTQHPDLDWSQVKETLVMLGLAIAQIKCSIHDSSVSINNLTEAFAKLSDQLAESAPMQEAELHIEQAIIAFQFYDRLDQRLDHVIKGLSGLGLLIDDSQRRYSPQAWADLQEAIKQSYSMQAEREMFEMIVKGKSIEEVVQHYIERHDNLSQPNAGKDDIELF
ncbi:hypothetical protein [Balneatrix alpica]|uniref:Uncharacterized protein n=1 Tax=Balneatrix alpica TaxID=75684 RepID=A0ABV5Z6I7_9GAMM|nr:hypothetical protein [Balneatrix alpica]